MVASAPFGKGAPGKDCQNCAFVNLILANYSDVVADCIEFFSTGPVNLPLSWYIDAS